MGSWLGVDFSEAVPIWRQIEDGVRRLVASGSLPPGSALPSVRELARELRVNPATVSKAYQRLSVAGVLVVRRGEGTFVADRPTDEVDAERRRLLAERARRYADEAASMGAGEDEAVDVLRGVWKRLKTEDQGGGP
jgi:GntR family transcriptional regulator